MTKSTKFLTIITVVKNDVKNIKKTIKSIIDQKNNTVEYVIVCGTSNDGTLDIVKKYKSKIDKIISEDDRGIYDAMNKGIRISEGKYIGFCNSGDIIYKGCLKIITDKIRKEQLDVLFSTVKRNYLGATIIKHGFNLNRLKLNFDFATSHSTAFYYKKNFHEKVGFYNTNFKISADYDFYLRLFRIKKLKIGSSHKKKIISEVAKGGYSSKFTYLQHLNEETKIRLNNKQNIVLIIVIYVYSVFYNFKKVLSSFFN